MAHGGPSLSKPPPVVSCVRSLQVDLASVDERAMHGEVLEFAGLGQPVSLAQCAEVVARANDSKTSLVGQVSTRTIPSGARRQTCKRILARGISSSIAS